MCLCVSEIEREKERQTNTDRQTDRVCRQTVQTDRQTAVLEQVWPSYVSYGCLK